MIPYFDFVQAKTLNGALKLLSGKGKNVKVIAGGTDIIPGFQIESRRFQNIERLIDINSIRELKSIEKKGNNILIGATATFAELANNSLINKYFPLLTKTAITIGSVQIRNRATIGGNLINNAPCADAVPPLLVYDAKIRLQSVKRTRELSLQKFLLKPYKTALKPDEILTKIILPIMPEDYCGDFYKLGRRRGVAISRITLAVLVKIEDSIIRDIRIASGAITPIGIRLTDLEKSAIGKTKSSEFLKDLSQKLGRNILEITGLRWSSSYKLPVVQQMFYQLLEKVCNETKS